MELCEKGNRATSVSMGSARPRKKIETRLICRWHAIWMQIYGRREDEEEIKDEDKDEDEQEDWWPSRVLDTLSR